MLRALGGSLPALRYSQESLSVLSVRQFHRSSPIHMPRGKVKPVTRRPEPLDEEEFMELMEQNFEGDDTTTLGHYLLQQERQNLYYLRLIEHEVPKLVAFRKPFEPLSPEKPVIIRSFDYSGEKHPATAKRVIVVPVARLPLRDMHAVHKFVLLAGVRWSEQPPRDAGVGIDEDGGEYGYVKIASETFSEPAMNLKWGSDVLDRLIREANDTTKDRFKNVPIDTRHLDAKLQKAKKGGHARGRALWRPTLDDFPERWLPPPGVSMVALKPQ